MSIYTAAEVLAELAEGVRDETPRAEFYIGVVTVSTGTSVTVLPDSADSVEIGPMALFGTATVGIGKKVLCVRLSSGGNGCLGEIKNG